LKRLPLVVCILSLASFASAVVQAKSGTLRTSDHVALHYFEGGSGPTIVFIPGWTMPAEIFEPQINQLVKQFHVVALDPRSQGDSEKTADGNTLERHAQDIRELIENLHLHDVVLLGWSNGVPDVLTFVEQNGTGYLRGVVLVDGLLDVSNAQMQKGMSSMLKAFQADRPKFTDGFVRSMYKSPRTDEYIKHVEELALKTPTNTAVVEMFNVLSKGDFTPVLAKLDKPVLYICQPQLEAQGQLLQKSLPNARVEVFKNSGHALFIDEAEHFNKLLAEFVGSLAGAPQQ
jgi:non-heme chloroperoxidase